MLKSIKFYKYQGTGNDFILVDNRNNIFPKNVQIIQNLCNRKFGIGSDGLILIENHSEYDFEMVFYNPDASQSFCGNGSRCAVAFAKTLNIIGDSCTFFAIDGVHSGTVNQDIVSIKMCDVSEIQSVNTDYFVNTGSPHYIHFDKDVKNLDMLLYGHHIRLSEKYKKAGTNVNVVEKIDENSIFMRTYERGVEDETLSCGTGVTACALTFGMLENSNEIAIQTLGGNLNVTFEKTNKGFENIWLKGPANFVFRGEITI